MPSPFPGMDPYLEDPAIWPDFHHAFATEIRNALNASLPSPYYARLEMRPELGIIADEEGYESTRRIVPDVLVLRRPGTETSAAGPAEVALLNPPRDQVTGFVEFDDLPAEPARHYFVEIRDSTLGHKLITLLEILRPSNKGKGPDRDAYAAKQADVLKTDASLIEIDLLRSGRRIIATPDLERAISGISPRPDYLVLVSRSWRRTGPMRGYVAYPFTLREWLPCIGVPLTCEQPELPLDLQYVFQHTYDGGPYRRGAVDYSKAPIPPLSVEDVVWAQTILQR
jgi:hypothetical protein